MVTFTIEFEIHPTIMRLKVLPIPTKKEAPHAR